jgi:glycosyltransferase involved in cell wall biosynthesis
MVQVSAIVPTYNRRPYLGRSLDSIFAQSVPLDEVIVVDDGSTDGTADAVAEIYGERVRLIRQANTGVSGARLRGIREARGEWVAFLDSDDEWMPDRNARLLRAATQVPADVAWIFGDLRVITDEGAGKTVFEEFGLKLSEDLHIFADALQAQYPFQFGMLQASFIRRSALLELGCFTSGLRSDDDLLAGFQIACHYRVAAINGVVGNYFRTSDLSASSVVVNGVYGPDHYRSRMLAFSEVIKTGRKKPWNSYYADEVRGLGKLLARKGTMPRGLMFEQFRYGGYSGKGIFFTVVALVGGGGAVRCWETIATKRRKCLVKSDGVAAEDSLRTKIQAAGANR